MGECYLVLRIVDFGIITVGRRARAVAFPSSDRNLIGTSRDGPRLWNGDRSGARMDAGHDSSEIAVMHVIGVVVIPLEAEDLKTQARVGAGIDRDVSTGARGAGEAEARTGNDVGH